jgi:predicted transcriptional regulator
MGISFLIYFRFLMKDNTDKSTVDYLQILQAQDDHEQSYREFNIVVNMISKIMLNSLSKTDMIILHKILTHAQFEQCDSFTINQTTLAKSLNKHQSNIARTIKKLVAAEMLEKLNDGNYKFILTDS